MNDSTYLLALGDDGAGLTLGREVVVETLEDGGGGHSSGKGTDDELLASSDGARQGQEELVVLLVDDVGASVRGRSEANSEGTSGGRGGGGGVDELDLGEGGDVGTVGGPVVAGDVRVELGHLTFVEDDLDLMDSQVVGIKGEDLELSTIGRVMNEGGVALDDHTALVDIEIEVHEHDASGGGKEILRIIAEFRSVKTQRYGGGCSMASTTERHLEE